MNTRFPIDTEPWRLKLEEIITKRIISGGELAKEIGIHYNTFMIFMDRNNKTVTKPKTLRIIDEYLKREGM
jgi:DNA-binding Xre family transcriptional regulator